MSQRGHEGEVEGLESESSDSSESLEDSDDSNEAEGIAEPVGNELQGWPWALRFVTAFLIIDTLKRIYQALAPFWRGAEKPYLQAAVQGLWVATNILVLILFFGLRARAGRLWLQLVLGIHAFYQAFYVIHQEPLLWFALSEEDRARIFLTIVIDLLLIHLMSRPEVAAALDS